MKKILCLVVAIVSLLAFAGCGGHAPKANAPGHQESRTEKVLRVGTDADYPPFEYYQEATKSYIGFDIELIQGAAREAGYSKVEFVDLEFNNLLPSLKDGQVDAVISCMNITDERRAVADFTEPYLNSANVAVALAGTKPGSIEAMKGKRVAVEIGSIHVGQAKEISDTIIECGDAEEALKLVADNKADFAIMDNYTARFFITNFYNGKLAIMTEMKDSKDEGIAVAVAKGNKELRDKLNEGLQKYQTTAAFLQMKKTYFGKLEG